MAGSLATSRVIVTEDRVEEVFSNISKLVGSDVLIGIPSANASRDDGDMNNAAIGYVMEFGSPSQNIPARPFLIPGVKKAEKPALAQLRKAATAALDGDMGKMKQGLNAAGVIGANEVRGEINSNIPPPLRPNTIRSRHIGRGSKSRRASEDQYLSLVAGGLDPGTAQSQAGIVALIDTGSLRNAITYVVREKK